ncbi:bacillithiol biosynthesis cysteine-adding enzyme BshC [Alicyclobacillus sp.]|uniref:bacillithiol biosynthesis cysteine-adding enzyme BshC n=1 Tax=Alicyclobacillus sp. TaxID=61169 RepID=UPI0025C5DD15|nr:bacillithiol biosynthesis cysteine-adding enzyme BshC [Alicyclobacillus sp.]MCL6515368.1 bacillithiol biosynthesis cysteine-adding enzyme BshC [Alicyclobacillus sp.]
MEWIRRRQSSGNRLTDLHQEMFHAVRDLYDGQDPRDLATYRRRAGEVLSGYPAALRARVVTALEAYMRALGANEAALAQLERLRDPNSLVVVTGQQAGLFTGPMYTAYKAMSAIGLARRLEEATGRPVVPVFWVAAEDHDWAEVNHAHVVDGADEIRRVQLATRVPERQMVHHARPRPDEVERVLEEVYSWLPDAPDKARVLAQVREAHLPEGTMADWFVRLLWQLVEPFGIVAINPCLPALREVAASVWLRTIEARDEVRQALDAAYDAVTALGLEPAVIRDPRNTTLFYVDDEGRRFVLEDAGDGTLEARGLGRSQPVAAWMRLAEDRPTAFSSNVLLRPVVQDTLLPVLAYVGGPAEIAYHALARGVFHAHGRRVPPLVLRDRVQVYPPSVVRNMQKWRVPEDIRDRAVDLVSPALEGLGVERVTAAVAGFAEESQRRWRRFAEALGDLGPQVADIARRQLERELAGIARTERKARRLFEQRHEAQIRQLRHIERWLWTDGHAQERRLCPLNVWTRFGMRWMADLPFWGDPEAAGAVYHVSL